MAPDRAQAQRSVLRLRAAFVRVAGHPVWARATALFMSVFQPVLVTSGVSLILMITYVYFTSVLKEVQPRQGTLVTACHGLLGVWVVFNALFNYYMCVRTPPGYTLDVDDQVLQSAANSHWTWCNKCNKHKPPLAHHCRICRRCVMKMDHHCPWMANCIGWANYRYFFLVVFYLWFACAYYTALALSTRPPAEAWSQWLEDLPFLDLLSLFLAGAVFLVLCVFMVWHGTLVLSGNGTIDFMLAWGDGESPWQHPYNLGWARNWQATFDVAGPLWWLAWCLPSTRRKAGWGYVLPTSGYSAVPLV